MSHTDESAKRPDFEGLVEQFYRSLYQFAFSLAQSESDACDLTQQTFYIWATKGHQIRDVSKVKSWLFTTLHRECLESPPLASINWIPLNCSSPCNRLMRFTMPQLRYSIWKITPIKK